MFIPSPNSSQLYTPVLTHSTLCPLYFKPIKTTLGCPDVPECCLPLERGRLTRKIASPSTFILKPYEPPVYASHSHILLLYSSQGLPLSVPISQTRLPAFIHNASGNRSQTWDQAPGLTLVPVLCHCYSGGHWILGSESNRMTTT